jgi:hypothetical protein
VSPILVRPVREQLEHDRVIRLLQAKSRRKFDAGINPGAQLNVPVGAGASALYPDVVLASLDRGRKIEALIEVETGESVNHLEALAQWAHYAKLRPAFHLYVPSTMVEVARRLCEDNKIEVTELWSYHGVGDDIRFALVHRAREVDHSRRQAVALAAPARPKPVPRPTPATRPSKAAKPTRKVASKPPARPKAAVKPKAAAKPKAASKPRAVVTKTARRPAKAQKRK